MSESTEVFLCDEGCGLRVDQEGGTCLACWEKIDASRELVEKEAA